MGFAVVGKQLQENMGKDIGAEKQIAEFQIWG